MKDLRRKLPSGSVSAALLNRKSYQGKVEGKFFKFLTFNLVTCNVLHLQDILIELMELESRYGVLPTYCKVVDDIVLMMDKVSYHQNQNVL